MLRQFCSYFNTSPNKHEVRAIKTLKNYNAILSERLDRLDKRIEDNIMCALLL